MILHARFRFVFRSSLLLSSVRSLCGRLRPSSGWLAAALMGIAAGSANAWTQTAAPEPVSCAGGSADEAVWSNTRTLESFGTSNLCIHDLSDGMAAVLLPVADGVDVPTGGAGSLPGHRWGFLNQQGQLAIEPAFEAVGPFKHGLAAARVEGRWGYIDPQGQWALAPQWEAAGEFTSAGLAVVTEDGRQTLINKSGTNLVPDWGRNIARISLDDGELARAVIVYRNEYVSPAGVRRYVSGNQRVLQQLGDGPFYVATMDGEKQGLLDADWRWQVPPVHDEIGDAMPSGMGTVRNGDLMQFIDSRNGEIGAAKYTELHAIADAFWLARSNEKPDGSYQLLDAQGTLLEDNIPEQATASMSQRGNMLLYQTDDALRLYVPGREQALVLPAAWVRYQDYDGYLFLYHDDDRLAGVVTPKGAVLDIAAVDTLAQANDLRVLGGRVWLFNDHRQLLNVMDQGGKLLLDREVVKQLADAPIRPLDLALEGAPLALITSSHCNCDDTGHGLLLADGRLLQNSSWEEIRLLFDDEGMDLPQSVDELRFAAVNDAGTVLLDAQGEVLDMPVQQHIADFRDGHALVFSKGVARLAALDGTLQDLPDFFDFRVVGPDRISYVEDAADGAPWGLYDIARQQVVAQPAYRKIGDFQDGQAIAADIQGKLGVIDTDGNWVIAAAYDDLRRAGNGYWLLLQREPGKDSYEWPAALANAQGKVLTPFVKGLRADRTGNGLTMATSRFQTWLIGPEGTALPVGSAYLNPVGEWLEIRRDVAFGLLTGAGKWAVEPGIAYLSAMREQRVLRRSNEGSELLDATGKPVASLGDGQWQWYEGSRYPARVALDDEGERLTEFVGGDGSIVAQARGNVLAFDGQRMLEQSSNGTFRWLDKQGEPISGFRSWLGLPRDGLAGAAAVDGTQAGLGYVGLQGTLTIPPVYQAISSFRNGRAIASTADASYMLDTSGRPLAWVSHECGVRVLRNGSGERVWPSANSEQACW